MSGSNADADLISLAESPRSGARPDLTSPASFGSIGKKMASPNGAHRDSFSDLVGVMRAKKPYTPVAWPTTRLSSLNVSHGIQDAARNISGSSIVSPIAKPFDATLTVAKFLEQQEKTPATLQDFGRGQNNLIDLDARLSALNNELNSLTFDDATERQTHTPSPHLAPFPGFRHANPPTPAESVGQSVSTYDRVPEPSVPVTKHRWTSVLEELDLLKKDKQELKRQLASLQIEHRAHLDVNHDVSAQLGKLKYQNEINRDQKAEMGRTLAQRDVKITTLQLEIEQLNKKVADLDHELGQCSSVNGEVEHLRRIVRENHISHARDYESYQTTICELELSVERLTTERDVAVRDSGQASDQTRRIQSLVETLTKREKLVTDLRQNMLQEQMRVTELEFELERLQELVNQESLDDVKEKLREKSSECDRYRTQVKTIEHQLKITSSRLMTATKNGELLRGAAHIVVPNERSKLPKKVMACSECYANNMPCDNGARCANCVLNNKKCARWRCSLKHRLLVCDRAPCAPPHDPEGWLVSEPRPEW